MAGLIGARRPWWEFAVAAWFGLKGFASVIYAVLVLQSAANLREPIFRLCAVIIAASIMLHSPSDVPLGRWLIRKDVEATRGGRGPIRFWWGFAGGGGCARGGLLRQACLVRRGAHGPSGLERVSERECHERASGRMCERIRAK